MLPDPLHQIEQRPTGPGLAGRSRPSRRVADFLRASPVERRLLPAAAVLLAVIGFGLRTISLSRLRGLLDGLAARGRSQRKQQASLGQISWAVRRASAVLPRATCLAQALAAKVLLERHGHPARVSIGVKRDESGSLQAHAWTESEGRIVVGGRIPERYRVIAQLGESTTGEPRAEQRES